MAAAIHSSTKLTSRTPQNNEIGFKMILNVKIPVIFRYSCHYPSAMQRNGDIL